MAESTVPTAIDAFYGKSNFFRVIHADGVYGGPSPRGVMAMSFFSERMSLPKHTRIPIAEGGIPGAEEVLETKGGVFRELEATIIMDVALAISFHIWLGKQIEELSKQVGMSSDILDKLRGI